MLLGAHPQIATIGEMKLSASAMGDLDRYRCSCGSLIQECGFWQKIKQGMEGRGFSFDLACAGTDYRAIGSHYARRILAASYRNLLLECMRDTALSLSLAWRKQLPRMHGQNAALAATVSEVTKAQVVVDSSKTSLRLKYLLRNPDLDVKVIRLIRDGRAVALTYIAPAEFADAEDPALRGGGSGAERENERLSMAQAAYQWRRCNEEAEHLLARLDKSQWIAVRYEDLCKNTENTLARLFEFLGVDPHKRTRDFRSIEQHVIGNGMRLDSTSEIHLDERWRSILTQDEMGIFDHVAGKMNRRYGYI
jgi:hypothetical protein